MNRSIFSINPSLIKGLRGRSAQITMNKELLKTNPDAAITEVSRKYEQFLKLNSLTKLPIYQYPKQANRLMEVIIYNILEAKINHYSLIIRDKDRTKKGI